LSRKITFILLSLIVATGAFADGRGKWSGGPTADMAALMPISAPGTTVSGIVSSVSGNVISLAGGLVTVDASQAQISDDRGGTATIAAITPGSMIVAVLSSSTVAANAPLPAMIIGVSRIPQVSLSGPLQSVGTSSFTLLGRTVAVDANTSFGGRAKSLAELLVNDIVHVQANNVNGALVATLITSQSPLPRPSTVIHGTVKSIGTDSWVITDRANKDWTIVVNAQTKIAGDPKAGDEVDILVNTDNANQYVAVSIIKSVRLDQVKMFMGEVKSIGPSAWVIRDSRSNTDVTVAVNANTKIMGDPHVNDGVQVLATEAAGQYTAVSIMKLGIVPPPARSVTINGVVRQISGPPCVHCGQPEVWEIVPASGPSVNVQVSESTKKTGNPHTGDTVEVVAIVVGNEYFATSITKR
jgi:hypothetical protein